MREVQKQQLKRQTRPSTTEIKEESGKLALTDINHLVYATASAVTVSLGMKTKVGCENPINQNGKRKFNVKYAKSGVTYLR